MNELRRIAHFMNSEGYRLIGPGWSHWAVFARVVFFDARGESADAEDGPPFFALFCGVGYVEDRRECHLLRMVRYAVHPTEGNTNLWTPEGDEYKMETSPILYDRELWTRWLTWREANADRVREADAVIDADCAEVIRAGRI